MEMFRLGEACKRLSMENKSLSLTEKETPATRLFQKNKALIKTLTQ